MFCTRFSLQNYRPPYRFDRRRFGINPAHLLSFYQFLLEKWDFDKPVSNFWWSPLDLHSFNLYLKRHKYQIVTLTLYLLIIAISFVYFSIDDKHFLCIDPERMFLVAQLPFVLVWLLYLHDPCDRFFLLLTFVESWVAVLLVLVVSIFQPFSIFTRLKIVLNESDNKRIGHLSLFWEHPFLYRFFIHVVVRVVLKIDEFYMLWYVGWYRNGESYLVLLPNMVKTASFRKTTLYCSVE